MPNERQEPPSTREIIDSIDWRALRICNARYEVAMAGLAVLLGAITLLIIEGVGTAIFAIAFFVGALVWLMRAIARLRAASAAPRFGRGDR